MAEADPVQLRLYCICGQKMRVSPSMFGKPGKCVACRQKLRIPTAAELPPDVTEIYIRDHPELLRKPMKPSRRKKTPPPPPAGEEEQVLGDGETARELPLEDLACLRVLCSLERKIQNKLDGLRGQGRSRGTVGEEKATLMNYRALVRTARSGLDVQLRQSLLKTEGQLAALEEDLGRACEAARRGDLEYQAYLRMTVEFRAQRELLVRQRQNLAGWLEVQDPYLAGGYLDLPLDEVPVEPPRFTLPPQPAISTPLATQAIEHLREALNQRELETKRRREREKLARDGSLSGLALEDAELRNLGGQRRAAAAAGFARSRLEQLIRDCEEDARTIKAQLALARDQLGEGKLGKGAYQVQEMALLRAQSDNNKVLALAQRALSARNASEVPRANSTLMLRLQRAGTEGAEGSRNDTWVAYLASLVALGTIFLPIVSGAPGGNLVAVPGLVLGLVFAAALYASVTAASSAALRCLLYTGLFLVSGFFAICYLYAVAHGDTPAGAVMRLQPHWYVSPGMAGLFMVGVLISTAAGLSSIDYPALRKWPPLTAIMLVCTLALAVTNFGGLFVPQVHLDEPEFNLSETEFGPFNTQLTIHNDGWRTVWLSGSEQDAATPVLLRLERRAGTGQWEDAGLPQSMKLDHVPWYDPVEENRLRPVAMRRGERALLRYALLPGTYRIQLQPLGQRETLSRTFEVPASMAISERMRLPEVAGEVGLPPAPEERVAPPAGSVPSQEFSLELSGVIDGEAQSPRFYVFVTLPGSRPMSRYLSLGEHIHGKWHAQEYNPETKSLVLSDGTEVVVVKAGEQVKMSFAPTG